MYLHFAADAAPCNIYFSIQYYVYINFCIRASYNKFFATILFILYQFSMYFNVYWIFNKRIFHIASGAIVFIYFFFDVSVMIKI